MIIYFNENSSQIELMFLEDWILSILKLKSPVIMSFIPVSTAWWIQSSILSSNISSPS